MLLENIREHEFLRAMDKLKDLDFADGSILETLYEYKVKDEYD